MIMVGTVIRAGSRIGRLTHSTKMFGLCGSSCIPTLTLSSTTSSSYWPSMKSLRKSFSVLAAVSREGLPAVLNSLPVELPEFRRPLPKSCIQDQLRHFLRMFHGENSGSLCPCRASEQVDLWHSS